MAKKTSRGKSGKVMVSLAILILGGALFMNWYFTNNNIAETLSPLLSNQTTKQEATSSKNLGEAAYVSGTTEKTTANPNENEYFTNARLDRQKARDSSLEELNKVLNNTSAGAEAQKVASEKIAKISDAITKENKIESLVKAKEVESCLAVIGDEKVEVIVKVKELTEAVILQIKEIVINQTKVNSENISIIEAK